MDKPVRRSPSGLFMTLIGLCVLALIVIIIYGVASSNPELVKQLIGAQSPAQEDEYGGMPYNDIPIDYYGGEYDGAYGDISPAINMPLNI